MTSRFWTGARLVTAPLLVLLAAACGAPAPPAAGEHTYTVAAEVIRISTPDAPRREIVLQHEAIPDFLDADGKKVGMEAMTMPFPVATGIDLGAFQPDDRVSATFVVRFQGSPPYEITKLEKISPTQ